LWTQEGNTAAESVQPGENLSLGAADPRLINVRKAEGRDYTFGLTTIAPVTEQIGAFIKYLDSVRVPRTSRGTLVLNPDDEIVTFPDGLGKGIKKVLEQTAKFAGLTVRYQPMPLGALRQDIKDWMNSEPLSREGLEGLPQDARKALNALLDVCLLVFTPVTFSALKSPDEDICLPARMAAVISVCEWQSGVYHTSVPKTRSMVMWPDAAKADLLKLWLPVFASSSEAVYLSLAKMIRRAIIKQLSSYPGEEIPEDVSSYFANLTYWCTLTVQGYMGRHLAKETKTVLRPGKPTPRNKNPKPVEEKVKVAVLPVINLSKARPVTDAERGKIRAFNARVKETMTSEIEKVIRTRVRRRDAIEAIDRVVTHMCAAAYDCVRKTNNVLRERANIVRVAVAKPLEEFAKQNNASPSDPRLTAEQAIAISKVREEATCIALEKPIEVEDLMRLLIERMSTAASDALPPTSAQEILIAPDVRREGAEGI
jgi:hypothetical protein